MNNRNYFRFSILHDAKFRLTNGSYTTAWGDCVVIDISGGGARISAPYKIPLEAFLIDISITVQNEEFLLHGEIVWLDGEASVRNQYKYGLNWVGVSEKDREKLIQQLAKCELELRKKR